MMTSEHHKHAGVWHEITIKAIDSDSMMVQHKKTNFSLPKEIIKHAVKPGDKLYMQVLDSEQKEDTHTNLAKQIINSILGQKNN